MHSTDRFETVVSFRLFDDIKQSVHDVVENNVFYENESHFYRVAVMKLLAEEKKKYEM